MKTDASSQARNFVQNEKQFHLGFLPTEQSNPVTAKVDEDFRASTAAGVKTLQLPDRDVLSMARRVLAGSEFARLVESGEKTLRNGGRIIFPVVARPAGSVYCSKPCGGMVFRN